MSIIIPANSAAGGGYAVANSLRFNSASTDYLSRSPGASNRNTWTWSGWVKRSKLGSNEDLFSAYGDANNYTDIRFFGTNDNIQFRNLSGGNFLGRKYTNAQYRDVSAWMHIVAVWDTTNGTAADRQRLYVNGERLTSFLTTGNPGSGQDSEINDTSTTQVGAKNGADLFNGYMAEVVFVDGTALAPTSFGEFDEDSNIWKPIDVSGLTFGTNGFYLDFEDSAALGDDVSGNGNDFTVNNLAAIDQTTDTCTNNFATANSVGSQRIGGGSIRPTAYSEGNLRVLLGSSEYYTRATSTIAVSTGKWYWETKMISNCDSGSDPTIGIIGTDGNQNAQTGTSPNSSMQYRYTGQKGYNDVGNASYGATWTNGDIIGIALDLTSATKTITFYKNNASQGVAFSGNGTSDGFNPASQYWSPFWVAGGSTNGTMDINFGNPTFTGTDQADGNSRGSFEYAPPSGFLSLCSLNLSEVLS